MWSRLHNRGMRGSLATFGSVLAVLVALSPATGAPTRDALVVPGRGIGKVRLGMSVREVERALGHRTLVNESRGLGFGLRYVELDWDGATWTVGFQGRPGALKVVKVATTLARQRTRQGLGPGSRIRDILRAYPQATCSSWAGLGTNSSMGRWVTVRHASGARTIFVVYYEGVALPPPGRVVEVMVQLPVAGVAERRDTCGLSWRRE